MPKLGMEPIRRQQVIEATLQCVINEGFEMVTLEKVAKIAGVSKGVVAYYFKSKNNLLIESCKAFYSEYMKNVEAFINDEENMRSAKQVIKYIGALTLGVNYHKYSKKQLDFESAAAFILQFYSKIAIDKEFAAIYKETYEGYKKAIDEIIKYGNTIGEWQVENVSQLTIQLLSMLEGAMLFGATHLFGSREELCTMFERFVDSI